MRRWHVQKHPTLYKLPWVANSYVTALMRCDLFLHIAHSKIVVIISVLTVKLKNLAHIRSLLCTVISYNILNLWEVETWNVVF